MAIGLYEAWRLAGGLVFLMLAMLTVVGAGIGSVVFTIRREKAEARARSLARAAQASTVTVAGKARRAQ